ncbi:MAG TPA: hypothetical protein VGR02_08110 [Thermoanaerobaculia bacterium]|nr:hypothetical protein [Thermoanaerobaculia bacterium]
MQIATLLALAAALSCAGAMPWAHEPIGDEVNVAFTIRNNLLFLPSTTIDGRTGRYFLGSAALRSVLDPALASRTLDRTHTLALNSKESLRFTPVVLDLAGTGDAILGSDVWGSHAVTIDYGAGLITYQKSGIHPDGMTLYAFQAEPAVLVNVNGRDISAIVDTAIPDTLVLPAGARSGRGTARIAIAGAALGEVDVRFAATPRARIGNRLLSKFLVTIDYGKRQVGLWRDPRIAL